MEVELQYVVWPLLNIAMMVSLRITLYAVLAMSRASLFTLTRSGIRLVYGVPAFLCWIVLAHCNPCHALYIPAPIKITYKLYLRDTIIATCTQLRYLYSGELAPT